MNRIITIASHRTHRGFETEVTDNNGGVTSKRNIRCPYDLGRDCTPDCAACDIIGDRANCLRGSFDFGQIS